MIIGSLIFILICADFPLIDHEESQYQPCVIFADSQYYLFWSDFRYSMSIFGARVTSDGSVLDSVGNFLYQGYSTYGIRAACDSENILITFRFGC